MKYLSLVNQHQQELADFPIMWAFNDEQFKEGMKKLGLKEDETNKIYSIDGGGFIRRKDATAFNEMFERHEREMKEAFQDDDFAYDAFLYELANHEFCISFDYEPTLSALGITVENLVADDSRLMNILKKAKDDYLKGIY